MFSMSYMPEIHADRRPTPRHGDAAEDVELARLGAIDLNLLVPLLALLEERSVTRAAARVGMTQPAMSHALRRMRRLLGDELLLRQGTGMALTPRGIELVAPLRRTLRQAVQVVRPTPFDPATDRRAITLAMTSSTASVVGGEVARLLAERAPQVVLRLRTMPVLSVSDSVFTQEGIDAILLSEVFTAPFPRERLYDDRWVVVTQPDLPSLTVAELLEALPHVVLEYSTFRTRPYEILEERGLRYSVRARVSDTLLIPHVIAAAGGVGFQRNSVVRALRHLDLRAHEFPFPIGGLGMDVVWNPWLADDELRSWLGGLLREAAARAGSASTREE
jgi:DNA-binding transcriptional LysR family regulator